jgi:hypothetical protein
MVRPLRIEYAGAAYHFLARTNQGHLMGHYRRVSQAVNLLQQKPVGKFERLFLEAGVEND